MSYANRILGSIPYGTLIGSPMTAAVEAQALAAQSSVNFIKAVGFDGATEDEAFGNVRQVTFEFQKTATDGTARTISLNVPILTIVPIPFLRIEDMTIDFTSKISEEMVKKTGSSNSVDFNTEVSGSYGAFFSPVKVKFKAGLSAKHSSTRSTSNRYSTEHTININVRAVQDDIPAGMSRVLDILESAIQEPPPSGGGGN